MSREHSIWTRRSGRVLAMVVAGLALAACSGSKPGTTSPTGAPSTTGTIPTGPAGTGTSSTQGPAPGSSRCHSSELSAALGAPQGAAGSTFTPLVLTNVGSRTCVVAGYPGVSLLDSSGAILGAPATREPGPEPQIALAPAAAAHSVIHTQNAIDPSTCGPTSTSVRVYPPDETTALTFAGGLRICGGVLAVVPISAGSA